MRPAADQVAWPVEFARRYRAGGLWRDEPLGHWMWVWADRFGARTAIVDGDRRISYRQLAEHADAFAERLGHQGIESGSRILVQLPNCWEFVAVLLGCARAGVVPVLALPAHREHEIGYLARHAEVEAIVVPDRWREFDHQQLAATIAAQLDRRCQVLVLGAQARSGAVDLGGLLEVDGDPQRRARLDAVRPDPAGVVLFLLSGGTTGQPKMIGRTHNDYEYNLRRSGEVCLFSEETTYLVALPASHNFPLGCPGILGTLAVGGRVVMSSSPEPRRAFATIARERVTVTSVVPAIAQRWVQFAATSDADLSSLGVVQVGGSVLDPALARAIPKALGARLQQVFGMAEGLLNYTRLDDPDEIVFGTQGRPISRDDELLVVDEDDRPVPPGETGELLTRGPYTPRGYFRADEHNARSFTRDGWYRTGDLVRLGPGGNLVVEGRRKDLINRGGEKISAEEVENLARELLAIQDALVVPAPDERFGELVCLVVVPGPAGPPGLEEVRTAFDCHGVAHYKIPERIEALDALPLTAVGKVDRKAVRRHVAGRTALLPTRTVAS
ncbi:MULTISPECIES: (2,3-dihydroxybenzoyl)adenylate synthase [unclassified Micromonospora]|uniref:(2,3-dihydroxybenzoyl)adenylate synthase n=1 Tax=unclassified Micromonospora TaxID=2617518 RepID=UPI0036428678